MNLINIALAIFELEHELERELRYRKINFEKHDRLYFLDQNYCPIFAQVTWINCKKETIASIGDGIKKLKAAGRNWSLFTIENHRRAQLIQEGLYKIKDQPIEFLGDLPKYPMGGWTLLDANTIVYSTETTSRFALGKCEFVENKTIPPSRAYLKLWELFTLHCKTPAKGTQVIDMGSCPGGWSWVLSELGLNVVSVDKAPLDPKIAKLANITFLQESAFALDPKSLPNIEWFFSDIICYPERLLTLIKKWMQESNTKNFVCTIKFQGEADFKVIDEFLKIDGSKIIHLYHNKHEVMWWLTKKY
ncbi:MAG: SAM-dependent methyltransferase [Candidatus Babeliales bacterium]|nr:SAM-dependent methyltransferase [Candidatus Babeliales bacterium]